MNYCQFLRFPEGKTKAVTFSYDDGVRQDIRLSEIFEKYGMKGTFNLNNQSLRKEMGLTTEEVQKHLIDKGHEIAVHGDRHRPEGILRPIEGIQDVLNNRLDLENLYGIIVRGMAYPDTGITHFLNNADYEKIKNYLEELDIVYARTLGGDNDKFELPKDWHAWMPTAHHANPQIFEYIDKFVKMDVNDEKTYLPRRHARLFYIWGHSYEFDRSADYTWDHMEKICEKLAFKEDTWYATNMEIYNYVTAYHSLVYSADSTRVYNPSVHTVWFSRGSKKLYSVKPGETIFIKED